MKKLLFFLLLPLFSFGQNAQVFLKYYNQDTNEEVGAFTPIEEGQVLRTEVHLVAVGSGDYTAMADTKYLFLDLQYNHDILSPVSDGFAFPGIDAITDPGVIKERYDFSNTSFGAFEPNLLQAHADWQAGTTVYSTNNAKWSVIRIAIQLSTKSFQDVLDDSTLETSLPIFDFTSVVKPGASSDPENANTRINLGVIQKADGSNITSFFPSNGNKQNYSVIEAVTYNAKLHFILPDALDPTNFQVAVSSFNPSGTSSDTSSDGPTTELITLDAAGDAIFTNVELNKEYSVFNLQPIDPSYIPNVHTVTDAYRSFKYLNDVGINGTDVIYNNFGLFSADANLNGTFNSGDVYGLLAYVMGVDVNANASEETPAYCLPEQDDQGNWFHGCTAAVTYENYTIEQLGATVDINNGGGVVGQAQENTGWSGAFTPTEDNLNFDFAFWHHVDLDQSHSTAFPANLTSKAAQVGLNLHSKAVGVTKLDMVSKIEEGKVLVELTHNGSDIVGLQARIKYDTSKLRLENIIYDTGNTVTNFSKNLNGELLFGGLSADGSENVKKGKTFVIEFTPIGTVNNVTGLFYFDNTDAVRADGDKMTLNIE